MMAVPWTDDQRTALDVDQKERAVEGPPDFGRADNLGTAFLRLPQQVGPFGLLRVQRWQVDRLLVVLPAGHFSLVQNNDRRAGPPRRDCGGQTARAAADDGHVGFEDARCLGRRDRGGVFQRWKGHLRLDPRPVAGGCHAGTLVRYAVDRHEAVLTHPHAAENAARLALGSLAEGAVSRFCQGSRNRRARRDGNAGAVECQRGPSIRLVHQAVPKCHQSCDGARPPPGAVLDADAAA